MNIYRIADKAKTLSQLHSWLCEVGKDDTDTAKAIAAEFEEHVDVLDAVMYKPAVQQYVENIGLNW